MSAHRFLAPLLICLSRTAEASTNLGVVVWGAQSSGGDIGSRASELRSNVQAIYSTYGAFAALKTNGEVLAWGDPDYGGDCSAVASQLSSNVIRIFNNIDSFAALKTGGEVVTWGRPNFGGDSSAVASQLRSDVVSVFNTHCAFAALKADGEVVTWGASAGGGDSSAVASKLRSEVVTIYSTSVAFAVLKTGGEVVTWGMRCCGGDSSAVASQLSSNVATIFNNYQAFAALKTGGEVVTWGSNFSGGNSSAVASQLRSNVTTIFSNLYCFAALKTGGEVVTWGPSLYGGDSSAVASQLRSNAITIFSNVHAFAALKTGGEVVTWGASSYGGNSSAVASRLRSNVTTIFGSNIPYEVDHCCESVVGAFAALKTGGEVVTWGDASSTNSAGDSSAVASQLRSDVITIFSSSMSFAALKSSGKVVTWGDHNSGGDPQRTPETCTSRVQSIVSSKAAFAALVCIPDGNSASTSNCTPCKPTEIWKDMKCQKCERLWEVPNAEQNACTKCDAGSVPDLQTRSKCTVCPFFRKPDGSQLMCEIDPLVVLVVAGAVLLAMLLSCPPYLRWVKKSRKQQIQQEISKMRNRDKIYKSFKSIHTLDFPMVILKAETLLEMQGLTSHETARVRNLLVFLDTVAAVSEFVSEYKIIFFSHQWLSFSDPDPDSIHYNCMVQALHRITDQRGWSLSDVYVWVDYTSIPQACSYTQKGAISSLPIYAAWSSAFVILAPNAPHRDLGCECNLQTYSKRTWCRVECLSHYSRRGSEDMLVSSAAGFQNITTDWLQDLLLIFEGDCTCCRLKHKDMPACDRELLVMPVLAMYIHVLLDRHNSMTSSHAYDVFQTLKSRMFPKTFTADFMLDPEMRIVRSYAPTFLQKVTTLKKPQKKDAEVEHIMEERELFGSVLDDLKLEAPRLVRQWSVIDDDNEVPKLSKSYRQMSVDSLLMNELCTIQAI